MIFNFNARFIAPPPSSRINRRVAIYRGVVDKDKQNITSQFCGNKQRAFKAGIKSPLEGWIREAETGWSLAFEQ